MLGYSILLNISVYQRINITSTYKCINRIHEQIRIKKALKARYKLYNPYNNALIDEMINLEDYFNKNLKKCTLTICILISDCPNKYELLLNTKFTYNEMRLL